MNENSSADYIFTSYSNGNRWIDWGIVRDENIKQVLINDKKANFVNIDKYNIRLCYLFGDETENTIPPNHELIY